MDPATTCDHRNCGRPAERYIDVHMGLELLRLYYCREHAGEGPEAKPIDGEER